MTRRPTEVQVLGVLRGAVEGSSTRYFGSLFGYPHWAGLAVRLGLVEPADAAESVSFHAATEAGREFYRRHRLDEFPGGARECLDRSPRRCGSLGPRRNRTARPEPRPGAVMGRIIIKAAPYPYHAARRITEAIQKRKQL